MGIWARVFGAAEEHQPPAIAAAGLLMDEDGWYYEESQDVSSNQTTIRIEQDRPGDWYVRDSLCGISGLDDPDRADDAARFLSGSYRWLHLERRSNGPNGRSTITVFGTCEDAKGNQQKVHLGFLEPELANDLANEDAAKLWARIRFIKVPGRGRRPKDLIRFDLMVELDDDIFD